MRKFEVSNTLIYIKNIYRLTLITTLGAVVLSACVDGFSKEFLGVLFQSSVLVVGLYFLKRFAHNLYRDEFKESDF